MDTFNNKPLTEEDFIRMFGCDRETYDKKLCENEERILRERERKYDYQRHMNTKTFIGKYLNYKNEKTYTNYKNVLITDIRDCPGYPEYFDPYYSIFTKDENGKEKWLINFPIDDFNLENPVFSSEPM